MKSVFAAFAAIVVAAGIVLSAAGSAQAETNRPVVRDHRSKPIIRDHRKPNFCFGAITGTNCYRL